MKITDGWIPNRVLCCQKQLCHKNCPSYKVLYCKPNISFWKIDDLGLSVRIKYLKIRVKYNNHQLLHQKGFFF